MGFTKYNIDVALFSKSGLMGMAACLRDHHGHFISVLMTGTVKRICTPQEAEAKAMQMAIAWTKNLGLK